MAPRWPEEVDVFSVPHSRMKKLVHKYSSMITTTDFRDEFHLTSLLKNLMNVFTEFKAHEQIENILIMKKLKIKLKAASVTSAAVCNCHSDNRLTDMLDLVCDGYRWAHKTEQERQMYGKKLRNALEVFTQNFIPHMEEEEEVFQPMLMQYFSYEELKELKAKVIHQHDISKQHEEYHCEKFVEELCISDESSDLLTDTQCHFSKLPTETCLQILSLLGPRDLARVGQVSQRFYHLSRDSSLWSRLHPVQWAWGNWSFIPETAGGVDGHGLTSSVDVDDVDKQGAYLCVDEDADVDESGDSDESENLGAEGLKQIIKEARMLTAIVKYLLPQVGAGVKVCDLAFSKGLSSSLVHKILKLCPNLEVLDLTHTNVGDIAFRELGVSSRQSKLRHLDLTGCENITDMTLISLASMGRQSLNPTLMSEKDVEIENVPRSCAQKLRVCCGRNTSCGSDHSEGHSHNSLPGMPSAGKDCTQESRGDTSDTHMQVEVESRGDTSDTPLCLAEPESKVDKGSCSVSMAQEESLTHDSCVNFTHKNSLFEEREILSSSDVNSFMDAFADFSLTPQLSCDNDVFHVDPLRRGSCSSITTRTCSSAGEVLEAFSDKLCCKTLKVSMGENTVPYMFSSANSTCNILASCTDANHKKPGNMDSEKCDKQGSVSSLEFLSLNGCYRISDQGLLALAQGEGTPQLYYLDLSGCTSVTAFGLSKLVSTSQRLDHANLYYCDNMTDDPYYSTASGCQNRQCETRFCCSLRE